MPRWDRLSQAQRAILSVGIIHRAFQLLLSRLGCLRLIEQQKGHFLGLFSALFFFEDIL